MFGSCTAHAAARADELSAPSTMNTIGASLPGKEWMVPMLVALPDFPVASSNVVYELLPVACPLC